MLELCLRLDAGQVTDRALSDAIEDMYDSDLQEILSLAHRGAAEKNIPQEKEILRLAKKYKLRSLMHFSVLLVEAKNRGSDLSQKLETEQSQMQKQRLLNARAAAKRAETKLSLPLVLLLLGLILICIAPAVMNI